MQDRFESEEWNEAEYDYRGWTYLTPPHTAGHALLDALRGAVSAGSGSVTRNCHVTRSLLPVLRASRCQQRLATAKTRLKINLDDAHHTQVHAIGLAPTLHITYSFTVPVASLICPLRIRRALPAGPAIAATGRSILGPILHPCSNPHHLSRHVRFGIRRLRRGR